MLKAENFEGAEPFTIAALAEELTFGEVFQFHRQGEYYTVVEVPTVPGRSHFMSPEGSVRTFMTSSPQVLVKDTTAGLVSVDTLTVGDVISLPEAKHMMYRKDGVKAYFAPIGQQGNVVRIALETLVDHVGHISDNNP